MFEIFGGGVAGAIGLFIAAAFVLLVIFNSDKLLDVVFFTPRRPTNVMPLRH